MPSQRPFITLEEHFLSHTAQEWSGDADPIGLKEFPSHITNKLLDMDSQRLQDMDAGHVRLQVISHTPTSGQAPLSVCRAANDELHAAVQSKISRFAGFAMLPMDDPTAAVAELTRCVRELGFVGTLVDNHANGIYYDDERFWPVFEKCQELDVPIYIHPTMPDPVMSTGQMGNYPKGVAQGLDMYAWGWHSATGVHVLRLFAAGLFDRYPRLKLVIGHMGEMLPFMLDRVTQIAERQWPKRERGLKKVWEENVYVTTSGMFSVAPMACLLRVSRVDHVLLSVDYPFSGNELGAAFVEELAGSGLCSEKEVDLIAFGNAEKLLGVKV